MEIRFDFWIWDFFLDRSIKYVLVYGQGDNWFFCLGVINEKDVININ